MKLLFISPKNKRYFLSKSQKEFHTSDGKLDLTKAKPGKIIKTHIGVEYKCVKPSFLDLLGNLKRGPQVVLPKDAAAIVAHTGISTGAKVLDSGTGSGWLTAFLANIVGPSGKIVSYEIRKDHHNIAKENITSLGLKNVKLKIGDITKGFSEKNLDLITLDILTPTKVPNIAKALKLGGYCVAYVPHVNQAEEFALFAKKKGLYVEKIVEVREHNYNISKKLKKSRSLPHTGFMVFVRKIIS